MSGITWPDLPEPTNGAFLFCHSCQSRASATRGDYSFWKDSDAIFTCHDEPMVLVREVRRLVRVPKAKRVKS